MFGYIKVFTKCCCNKSPPPYRPDMSASMIEFPVNTHDNMVPVQHVPRSATTSHIDEVGYQPGVNPAIHESEPVSEEDIHAESVQPAMAYVIDTSTRSMDQTLFPHSANETISNTLHQRFTNELLSPEVSICEREVFEVSLDKQPTVGIGITIVGGDISSKHDFGIFVKSVTVDGPAFKDGRIKPGDRLIAINDQSLEGLQHHEAVTMIKESPDTVKLLISQIKPPGSLKRRETEIDTESDEEHSSLDHSADESSSPRVITVRNCTSVHNQENTEKVNNKNSENCKKREKNVEIVREDVDNTERMDQDRAPSATIDVHSTFSQVDSLYTEMAVSELPADLQDDDNTEAVNESDTDSEFDEVIENVIENTYKSPQKNKSQSPARVQRIDSEEEESITFEVFLEKQQGSFGLNVTGGVNTCVRHGGIYVKSIVPGSAADLDENIKKGDRILEVDSMSLNGFTHREAVESLCKAPPFCKLLVQRLPRSRNSSSSSSNRSAVSKNRLAGSPSDSVDQTNQRQETGDQNEDIYSLFVTEENTYAVDLVKGIYGLGFSTVGGHQDDHAQLEERVVRIKRVFPIGPAADSKVIHSGDVILAVNGQSVAGLSHTETMSRLRGAGKNVQLLMCQPDPDKIPPLFQLESESSLEITPTGSTANVTDTESDTDSEIDVTPRREALITPPTGFALSPYPKDEDGNIMPKIASPPPPLPVSPPPTLLSSGNYDNGENEIEVQVGVAELMDSCNQEMVLIHNAKKVNASQATLNGSLIVREDSAVTVNSRDVTPVVQYSSREATPCVDVAGDITPVQDEETDIEQVDLNSSRHFSEESFQSGPETSVPDSLIEKLDGINSLENTLQSQNSQPEVFSETDSGSLSKTDISTSFIVEDRLGTNSLQGEGTQSAQVSLEIGTSLTNTYNVGQNNRNLDDCVKDDPDGANVHTHDIENVVHSEESLNYSKFIVNIDENNSKIVHENNDEHSDVDDDVRELEKKYEELDNAYDEVDDTDDDEDDYSDDDTNNDDVSDQEVNVENNEVKNDYANERDDESELNEQENEIDPEGIENNCEDEEDVDDDDENINIQDEGEVKIESMNKDDHDDVDDVEEDDVDKEEESVSDHSSVRGSPSPTVESKPLKPGELEVTLTKPEGRGLGFTVAGGAKTTGGCYIKAVLQSPALSDGTLKSGDRLIMVNGIDMRPLNHFEAVSVLREAEDEVTIRVSREQSTVGDTGEASVEISSYSQGLTDEEKRSLQHEGTENVDKHTDHENSDSDDDDVMDSVTDGDGCGPLQDLITSLEESLEQTRISENLRNEEGKSKENFWKDKSQKEAESPKLQKSTNSGELSVYQIDLEKPESGGLGISLVTAETQNQTGVFIRTITPGGVAENDGRLQIGDKILQINGESLIGLNHNKAAAILRSSQGKLSLTVSRNKGRKPTWLDSDKTENQPRSVSRMSRSNSEQQKELETSEKEVKSVLGKDDDVFESESETSDLNNTSLSITKHVPSDIVDDNVDDLVAQAEQILRDADIDTFTESEVSDTDGIDKETAKDAHKFLSAAEVIDLHHDKVFIESEEENGKENVHESETESKSEQCNDEGEKRLSNTGSNLICEDDSDKYWCNSLRTLDLTVPDEVTVDWLFNLSLVTIPEPMKSSVPNIISDMQEKIEIEDPQEEFKQLRNVPLTDDCNTATLSNNRLKNRFRNVLPYDANRVRLSDDADTDYINASHVRVDVGSADVGSAICDYIVGQGPLPETTDDFWNMVWQTEVTVIVMLTLDMEAMKVKCHRYWPDSVDIPIEACKGQLRLSLLYQNSLDNFDIRNILIENTETGESRCLYHLNYTTWPDHGTPTSAVPLLQCMRLSHLYRTTGPIVVHCSAGIGRSGTFIAIDVALAHIERGLKFDLFEIVQELRRQRQGMIQTRDQYSFCYTACVEALLETPS